MKNSKEQTEKVILLAAEEEFMQRGYDGAKTMRIAEKAGVTHAMLHYYFGTKQNLFETVLQSKIALLGQSVIDAFTPGGDLPLIERIEKGVLAHFDFVAQNPLLPRFLLLELPIRGDIVGRVIAFVVENGREIVESLQGQLDEQVTLGTFKPIQAMDLLLDMASLNVFPFLALPVFEAVGSKVFGLTTDEILARRRDEIRRIIRARLLTDNREQEEYIPAQTSEI